MGTSVTRALGRARRIPFAIERAASMAERLSLKALGATRILKGVECDGMRIFRGSRVGVVRHSRESGNQSFPFADAVFPLSRDFGVWTFFKKCSGKEAAASS
jgi:hypothetical protein